MNVFVLCTGRCGSHAFAEVCARYITNYSVSHERNISNIFARLDYPENHIEIDNRLSWFLGRLDIEYGNSAFYVHLKRNQIDTVTSLAKRYHFGIIEAYRTGIYLGMDTDVDRVEVATDYYVTVTSNIDLFLKDKAHKMIIDIEDLRDTFPLFCKAIGANTSDN